MVKHAEITTIHAQIMQNHAEIMPIQDKSSLNDGKTY